MKLEIEASWKELTCICLAIVLCVAAFQGGKYMGQKSANDAAVKIDKSSIEAAASAFK